MNIIQKTGMWAIVLLALIAVGAILKHVAPETVASAEFSRSGARVVEKGELTNDWKRFHIPVNKWCGVSPDIESTKIHVRPNGETEYEYVTNFSGVRIRLSTGEPMPRTPIRVRYIDFKSEAETGTGSAYTIHCQ